MRPFRVCTRLAFLAIVHMTIVKNKKIGINAMSRAFNRKIVR